MSLEEIVIRIPDRLPGWPCPACGGLGHYMDSSASFSPNEIRIKPATKCSVCKGKGRVKVVPVEE